MTWKYRYFTVRCDEILSFTRPFVLNSLIDLPSPENDENAIVSMGIACRPCVLQSPTNTIIKFTS